MSEHPDREARTARFAEFVSRRAEAFGAASRNYFQTHGQGALLFHVRDLTGGETFEHDNSAAAFEPKYITRESAAEQGMTTLLGVIDNYDPAMEAVAAAQYYDGRFDVIRFRGGPSATPGD
jgi:hypothetical protein